MNDAKGKLSHMTPMRKRTTKWFRLTAGPTMTLVAVLASAVIYSPSPVSAESLAQAQAQATALNAELATTGAQLSELSQTFDGAKYHLSQIQNQEAQTQGQIAQTKAQVASDKVSLTEAALNAYISNGQQASSNPLFSSDAKTFEAQAEYGHIVNGTLDTAVSSLTNAQDQLNAQEAQLQTQQVSAQAATNGAAQAVSQANALQAQQQSLLSQAKGEVATLMAQQQAAQAVAQKAAAVAAASGSSGSSGRGGNSCGSCTPPPPSPGGSGAVAAAESQIGVMYQWGGATPGEGFDCSGLFMWAWGQAGVSLPHYSGAQQADTAQVPSLANAEPGDGIFYGPGGSDHVAMYIGGGMMIEAPQTGYPIHITPVRMDFEYIGRP